jgi:RNA polymerase sigma factor (sigma-70 family)
VERITDTAIVASIVAGEPEGLAAAYDKYADDLYGYCRSMMREPADAADAVQDTFVAAALKLGGLREPERLRAWLFAVARNECLRRLKSRRTAPLDDVPELPDDSVDVSGGPERAEAVALVRAAVGGLNDGERDVINQLWHGLEVPEVAAVLGVSRNHAYALYSRAREQLEASVAVLVVGRAGRGDCATLNGLLGDWDGRVTTLLRKRVGRHIDRCAVCSDRRRREFTPAMFYGLSAGAVLSIGALRGGALHRAASALPANPLALDPVGQTASVKASAAGRATMPLREDGFPRPARHGHLGLLHSTRLRAAAAGTVTAAAATAAVLVVTPSLRPVPPPPGASPTASASSFTGKPAGPGGGATSGPPASGPAAGGAATRGASRPAGGATDTGPGAAGSPGADGNASAAQRSTGTPALARAATSAAPAASGSEPASATASATVTQASAPPAPAPGTLSVSPTAVLLTPVLGGTLTLTASGGPVAWSVSEPSSLIGKLTVSPSAGTLSAGSSATVTITVSGLASVDSQLTVSPGGHVVTVVLGLG